MKVAIVGYGIEGVSSAAYWQKQGAEITICDQNPDTVIPEGCSAQLGDKYLTGLDNFDLVVRSAGIHPRVLIGQTPQLANKITTNLQEFFRTCPSKNIIGVTGTKGKGTTSTLIAKMLETAGKTVHLCGNIGVAPLELLDTIQPDDYVVVEISSFQLEDFKGPSPHIAVCLMVVPEHLNWHANMDEYVAAKGQLFAHQTAEDIAIYFGDNDISATIGALSPGQKIPYYQSPGAVVTDDQIVINNLPICRTSEIALKGRHNWQNICAALTAAWQVTQDKAAVEAVITSFRGLEHRLEFVREFRGVSYFDDSFATTPETAIAALEAFEEPKVVILGGSDKGVPLDILSQAVLRTNVKQVIAIGDMGPVIASQLRALGFQNIVEGLTTMPEMIAKATELSSPGDVILLSTGCASFGLFKDYKDRGNQFKSAVRALS